MKKMIHPTKGTANVGEWQEAEYIKLGYKDVATIEVEEPVVVTTSSGANTVVVTVEEKTEPKQKSKLKLKLKKG